MENFGAERIKDEAILVARLLLCRAFHRIRLGHAHELLGHGRLHNAAQPPRALGYR
jgi:hypothetical protein